MIGKTKLSLKVQWLIALLIVGLTPIMGWIAYNLGKSLA